MRLIQKDLTTVHAPGLIAHGVNCQNAMGSGVAKALYTKWPEVKSKYHKLGMVNMVLGHAQFVQVESNLFVVNCFTQEFYGRDGRPYASPNAIETALDKVCDFASHAIFLPNFIHLPPIGCGLGGLDFEVDVEPILHVLEEKWHRRHIKFLVCEIA